MNRWGYDDTRGVVVGDVSTKKHYTLGFIKDRNPADYRAGIEMRQYY